MDITTKINGDVAVINLQGRLDLNSANQLKDASREYFSKDNQSKGIYWNINTPIELYIDPFRLQYVDLEIDLVKRKNGEIQILDEEKLERVFAEEYLSQKLKQIALDKLYELKSTIEKN